MTEPILVRVHLYYGRPRERGEFSSTIQFVADSPRHAIADAERWFKVRQASVPEIFGQLRCVEAYHVVPGRIDERGRLSSDAGLFGFEWKHDTAGRSLADYADSKLGQLP